MKPMLLPALQTTVSPLPGLATIILLAWGLSCSSESSPATNDSTDRAAGTTLPGNTGAESISGNGNRSDGDLAALSNSGTGASEAPNTEAPLAAGGGNSDGLSTSTDSTRGTAGAPPDSAVPARVYEVQYDDQGCPLVPPLKLTRVVALTQTGMLLDQAAGDERIFIAERPGRILILRNNSVEPTPFLDFRSSIAPLETERGLLSMALHPRFTETGRFFVIYTRAVDDPMTPELASLGDLVVAEGKVSPDDPNQAAPTLAPLFTIPKEVRYHNGGMLAFGPDGFLYVSTGEDGRIYGPNSDSLQEVDHKLGKILRVDVDAPNSSPPGNIPGADIHVWDYGLRNPWRMSFDRLTGDLYIGDVGEATYDEIIYEPLGEGGRNYGWGVLEANQCNAPFGDCSTNGLTPPILAIPHDGPGSVNNTCVNDFEQEAAECNRAVVGGYVYRGARLPELNGRYFYGDNIQNTVRSFIVNNGEVSCQATHTADLVDSDTRIAGMVSFSEDAAGELYILDLFGNIYRIERQ